MITLKDLAEKLDVSVSTVSKALNGSHEISEHTIARVKALAKYYNYQPNKIALSLKQNKTKTIGVIVPDILNRFFARVLNGIEKAATEKGYNIITCMSNESLEKERSSMQLLSNGSVDGFILAVSEETQLIKDFSHFEATLRSKVPIVMFDRVVKDMACDKVIIDDYKAIQETVKTLIKKGKKHIGFISTISNLNVGDLRKRGYEEAINNTSDSLILNLTEKEDIQDQIKFFITENPQMDSVIAADNMSGSIFINVATNLGYNIPKDISVIGFADATISNMSVPRLAYLNQDAEQMGARALHLMINRLSNEEKPYVVEQIDVSLFKQGSM